MAETTEYGQRICVTGTEVLRYRICLPQWERYAVMSELYREIGARAARYCEEVLRPYAERCYEESEQADKRFRFPAFCYALEGRVTYEDERVVSVGLTVQWRRRGAREALAQYVEGHTWQREEECLLPPRQALLALGVGQLSQRMLHADGVIREGETLWLYRNGVRRAWNEA